MPTKIRSGYVRNQPTGLVAPAFFDSLVVASALENNCTLLWSEDMQDGLVVDKVLTVKSPFKTP